MLDSRLRFLAAARQEVEPDLASLEATGRFALSAAEGAAPVVRVLVQVDEQVSGQELAQAGLAVTSRAGDVVSGDISLDALDDLDAIEGVVLVEASRPMQKELDASLPETRANVVHTGPPGRRGAGVIVGIIDSGIDWRHQCFRNPTGGTRVLRIWDQNLTPQPGEASPAPFGYGVEYDRATIDSALAAANPLGVVRHMDDSLGHGTHVAGIAAGDGSVAGNGSPAFTFVGVAPEADIVMVANRVTTEALGDSASTLDAVRYIFGVARGLGRPAVVNLSQGDNVGPHDGTSLLERGIDNLLGAAGQAMVKSAGNAAGAGIHASGTVPAGGTDVVSLTVPANDTDPDTLDFWYGGPDRLGIRITPPGGVASAEVTPGNTVNLTFANGNRAFVDSVLNHPNNGDNRIYVQLQRGTQGAIAAGTWRITLRAISVTSGAWHGWIERGRPVPAFLPPHRNDAVTISVPGTAREVITAASYITKGAGVGSLATSSSRGPTRDNRAAPTLAAPGQMVMSALVGASGANQYQLMGGTSMAAPHITGAIALMLQARPALTQPDIVACLTSTARTDAQTGAVPNPDWGRGKLDAEAAVRCARPPVLTGLTRFTPFTRFTAPLTRITPFTRFTGFTQPLTRFTRFTPFTFPLFTRPISGPPGPGPGPGPDPFSRTGPVVPFVRFGNTVFDPAHLGLDRVPELGAYTEPLASVGVHRLDQLATTDPDALAEAVGLDPGEAADLVEYAQRLLRALGGS